MKYVKDEVVSVLFNSRTAMYASQVASNMGRDKEFIKRMLLELEEAGILTRFDRSKKGRAYKERCRWRLRPEVEKAFRQMQ
ncbi:MAG: hypothetical protein KJ955_06065 [Nanoarchaeota archaeon]|nr:hypothetical protein [Nanoarchaeota archaeon]